jgi:hypothetical protein
VNLADQNETGYYVVQATWLTVDKKEASVSWAFRIKAASSAVG